jgi:hypothetical protein
MAFIHSPKIVTDGLVLALDAGNTKSYTSGSTTWFDKSGFGNNGTLTNGPTFSSANGGSIVFDGVNDYVSCPTTTMPNPFINFTFNIYTGSTLPITGGLQLWLDGADSSTFTTSSQYLVAQWRDKSGNNRHASQESTIYQPKRFGTKNGYGAVYFSANYMTTGNFFNYVEYTKIAVHIHRSNTSNTTGNIVSSQNGNHATWYNGGPYFSTYHNGSVAASSVSTLNTWNVGLAEFSGSSGNLTSNIYINNTLTGTGITTTDATPNSNIELGGFAGPGNYLTGSIAEVLVYNRVLTLTEKTDIYNYLNNKWGITTNATELFSTTPSPNFNGYTKIAWFNPSIYITNNNIISGGVNDGQHAFWMAGGTKLNAGHNGTWNRVVSTTTIDLNKWWFGAVTFHPTDGWKLYVNGVLESTNNNTDVYINGRIVRIGAFDNNSNLFTGQINMTQIYNRALSAQEVLQNYNATKGRFGL